MNNKPFVNQTQFSLEEPIFEDTEMYAGENEEEIAKIQEVIQKRKKKTFIILGVVALALTLLILMIVYLYNNNEILSDPDEEELVEVIPESDPIIERINAARLELEAADPTKQDLVFPPVNFQLRLEAN
jgi:hypothetical protein